MELSNECKRVVDSVISLSLHGSPSMFWNEMQNQTTINPDRISGILKRWAIGDDRDADYEDRLNLLSYALDIQSQSMYGMDWDDLCGTGSWSAICQIGEIK